MILSSIYQGDQSMSMIRAHFLLNNPYFSLYPYNIKEKHSFIHKIDMEKFELLFYYTYHLMGISIEDLDHFLFDPTVKLYFLSSFQRRMSHDLFICKRKNKYYYYLNNLEFQYNLVPLNNHQSKI
jgi:hypothetical protein